MSWTPSLNHKKCVLDTELLVWVCANGKAIPLHLRTKNAINIRSNHSPIATSAKPPHPSVCQSWNDSLNEPTVPYIISLEFLNSFLSRFKSNKCERL